VSHIDVRAPFVRGQVRLLRKRFKRASVAHFRAILVRPQLRHVADCPRCVLTPVRHRIQGGTGSSGSDSERMSCGWLSPGGGGGVEGSQAQVTAVLDRKQAAGWTWLVRGCDITTPHVHVLGRYTARAFGEWRGRRFGTFDGKSGVACVKHQPLVRIRDRHHHCDSGSICRRRRRRRSSNRRRSLRRRRKRRRRRRSGGGGGSGSTTHPSGAAVRRPYKLAWGCHAS
jgi:hypothetical protein